MNKWGLMRLPRERTEREGKGGCLPTSLEGFHYFNTKFKCAGMCWLLISPRNLGESGCSRAVRREALLERESPLERVAERG